MPTLMSFQLETKLRGLPPTPDLLALTPETKLRHCTARTRVSCLPTKSLLTARSPGVAGQPTELPQTPTDTRAATGTRSKAGASP